MSQPNSIVTVQCPSGHQVYVLRSQTGATCFKCKPGAYFKIEKAPERPTHKGESAS